MFLFPYISPSPSPTLSTSLFTMSASPADRIISTIFLDSMLLLLLLLLLSRFICVRLCATP